MGFFQQRDFNLFKHFNREHINDWVDTPVTIYKVDMNTTETNLYGESVGGKTYEVGFRIPALIQREDQQVTYEEFGSDINQTMEFRFLRETLEEVSFNPDIGDIIEYNEAYFEIDSRVENQFIAGNNQFSLSIIVTGVMKRKSSLNLA